MPASARTVAIQNRHPRLRVPVPAVRRMIARLDEEFRIGAADIASFVPARARAAQGVVGKSSIKKSYSKIPSACPPGELSIVFLTDAALAGLHKDFMNDPTATDVITFSGDSSAGLAGEICVSADTAARYVGLRLAAGRRTPAAAKLAAFSRELALYVVHGWLHLAGYDDLRPDRKRRMRAAERRALRLLEQSGLLPRFQLR